MKTKLKMIFYILKGGSVAYKIKIDFDNHKIIALAKPAIINECDLTDVKEIIGQDDDN